MSKMNQKRRARALRRLHESQRCRTCNEPGATETRKIRIAIAGKPSVVNVFYHRKCLPELVAKRASEQAFKAVFKRDNAA